MKTSEDLSGTLSYLLEQHHTILETFQGDLESVLLGINAPEDVATHVAANLLAFRIGRNTLQSYINLLNHLSGVNNTRGWEYCKSQLNHHAFRIGLIWNKYRHRIQVVSKVYIYLRDNQAKDWMSLKVQNAEIKTLRAQMSNQTGEGGGSVSGYTCSWCKSALHVGGRNTCPWKDKTSSEAKKEAAAFMLKMSTGGVTLPPTDL